MDGGSELVAKAVAEGPKVVGPGMTQTAPAAPTQLAWILIPVAALALLFIVALLRRLPLTDGARSRLPTSIAWLIFWPALALGIVFASWQGALWSAFHALPAAGLAYFLLKLADRGGK